MERGARGPRPTHSPRAAQRRVRACPALGASCSAGLRRARQGRSCEEARPSKRSPALRPVFCDSAASNVSLKLKQALLCFVVKRCRVELVRRQANALARSSARTCKHCLVFVAQRVLEAAALTFAERTPLEEIGCVLARQHVHSPVHVKARLQSRCSQASLPSEFVLFSGRLWLCTCSTAPQRTRTRHGGARRPQPGARALRRCSARRVKTSSSLCGGAARSYALHAPYDSRMRVWHVTGVACGVVNGEGRTLASCDTASSDDATYDHATISRARRPGALCYRLCPPL